MITDEQRTTATQLAQREFRIVVQSGYNEGYSRDNNWRAVWMGFNGDEFIEAYGDTEADAVRVLRKDIAEMFADLMCEGWQVLPPGEHDGNFWRDAFRGLEGRTNELQTKNDSLRSRIAELESTNDDIELVDNAIHSRLTGHIVSSHIADTPPGFEGEGDQ